MNSSLGDFIKNKRNKLNLTQQEVADFVGVTKSAVSRWENGDIYKITINKVPKLASILQIDPFNIIFFNNHSVTQKSMIDEIIYKLKNSNFESENLVDINNYIDFLKQNNKKNKGKP